MTNLIKDKNKSKNNQKNHEVLVYDFWYDGYSAALGFSQKKIHNKGNNTNTNEDLKSLYWK